MVHALHTIARLLKPSGALIDIHPSSDPPGITVRTPAGSRFAGSLEEEDDFVEYGQAQAALEQAVADGTFVLEHRGQFTFVTHAEGLKALQDYLAENWKDAILTPEVVRKAAALFEPPERGEEILLSEQIDIARLRRKR